MSNADEFAKQLRIAFHAGAQQLNRSLDSLTDAGVLALWVAYDVDFTNKGVYEAALKDVFYRYQKQVQTIGVSSQVSRVLVKVTGTRAYCVNAYGKLRLALLSDTDMRTLLGSRESRSFWLWISDDMVPFAIQVTQERFGKI